MNDNKGQQASQQQTADAQLAEFQDCTPCRVMGGTTFIALGAYAWFNMPKDEPIKPNLPFWKSVGARIQPAIVKPLPWLLIGVGVVRLLGIDDSFRRTHESRVQE